MGRCQVVKVGILGEIERHQRLKSLTFGQGSQNSVAVSCGLCAGCHGWHEIGHNDCAAEVTDSFGQHGGKHCPIAQMQMPIIGAAYCQRCNHAGSVTQSLR